ncbi:MAG: hypothetical protein HDR47_05870 [Bacteroides sp.]|nr:hypothetical protein [Bacteroides sp.]
MERQPPLAPPPLPMERRLPAAIVPNPPNYGLEAPAGPYRTYGPYRSLPIPVMEVTICLRAAAGSRRSMPKSPTAPTTFAPFA